MGFTGMEHFASTLATTAAAVFGLVVAAHVLHPGNFEAQVRPHRVAAAEAPAPTVWVDPPAEFRVASLAGQTDTAALLAPRVTMVLPPEVATTQPLPSTMTYAAERTAKAETPPRRRTVQRERRVRQAALERSAVARSGPDAAGSAGPAPQTEAKSDPIGDLIRGLGLDG